AEDDEGNNLASLALTVKRRIDLSINTQNIIFSNDKPLEGERITIYATVANRREDAAEAVPVVFHLGNPSEGGIFLGQSLLDHLAGNSTALAICTFDTSGLTGPQVVYVTVDPNDALVEVDEHNNQALNVVYVIPRPDLVVTGITAGTMTEGVPGNISITIRNDGGSTAGACKVRLALDDASLADFLGDVAIGAINPGATATINLTLDTVALAGTHVIYVKADAADEVNEKDETNNIAAASFTINPAPELSVDPAEISFVSPGKKRVIKHTATKDDSYIAAVDAGGTNYNTCTNAKLAVAGGTPVTISVWARGEKGGEAIELVLFEYPGPVASGRILASKVFNITADWQEYSLTAVTGTNAVATWGRLDNNLKDQVVYWCDPRLLNADFTDGFAFVHTSDTYLLQFFTANNGTCRIEPSVGFPQTIHEGDEVAVNILVRNNTSAAANNVPVRLERYADGGWETLSTLSVSVPGNQWAFATFSWDSRGHVGQNRFRVIVDPEYRFYERDKANNLAEKELVVEPAVLPDLAVTSGSIAVHPRPAARDGVYTLQAEIRNLRLAGAENVPVSFYRGHPMADGVLIGEATVTVAGGGSTIAEVAWDTTGLMGWQAIYVWVDPANTVAEEDDCNNLAAAVFRLRANASYQPQNLRAEAVLNDVNLAWDPVDQPDVIGYVLYRDGLLINPTTTAVRGDARASSQYSSSYVAGKATDANTGTYWLSGSFTAAQWFEEEFAAIQFIEEIEIVWQTGYIGRDYQIQVWDGARYETVLGVTGNTATVRVHKLAEAGLAIRRYRILITRSNAGYVGIAEVKLKARAIITETEYRDASLTSGEYFYNVTSLNQQSEESLPSAAAGVTVLPPAGPAAFTARVQGPDVLLSWEPSSNPDLLGYYLRRDGIFLGGTEPTAGTASACGYYSSSYTPDKALDGNESTFWYLASLPSDTWWQMTIPAKRYLSAITINWRYQPQDFQILGWQNGAWMLLAEIKNNTKTVTSFDFAQRPKLEAIRIKITRSSYGYVGINEVLLTVQKRLTDCAYLDENLKAGSYSYSLTAENSLFCESEPVRVEAAVSPPAPPFALQAEVSGADVVLSWSHQQTPGLAGYLIFRNGAIVNRNQLVDCISSGMVSASSRYSDSYAPAKAADGNTGTYWLSAGSGYPAWFEVTFREPKILAGLRLLWHASYYGRDYQIQYRSDGRWVAVASVRGNQASDITHDFAHLVLTDGIRIYCTAGVNTSYLGILELAVYENVLDTVMSHRDPALPDGRYEYAVAARDKAGNQSAPSAPLTVEVGGISSPYNLSGTAVENQVILQWEIPRFDGIAGFRLYRDYLEINPEKNIANTASFTASHNNSIVTRAADNNLNTYWYPGGNVYPASIEMSFAAPVEIGKVGVHWYSSNYAARDYDLLVWMDDTWIEMGRIRGNTGANNEIAFGRILATDRIKLVFLAGPSYIYLAELRVYAANLVKDLSYTDTVQQNRTYVYFVRAVSDTGTLSAASNIIQVEVAERTPPAVPGDFRVTEGNGFLRLQWTANTEPDLAGYYIYLGDSGQPLNSSLLSKTAVQFDYSLPAATKEFTFKLVAVDINGNRSAPAEAVFVFSPPLAPQNPRATVSGRSITFTWSPSPSLNLFGYKIYRNGLLLNNLQKLTPNSVMASSYYFGNSSYAPAKVNDNNESTYWRPAIEDPAPSLELGFGAKKLLSAITFAWHSQDEIPESYSIQAFTDGVWMTVFTGDDSVKRTIYLPQTVVADRMRLVIEDAAARAGLAEFAGYEAARITSTTHTSTDLAPGRYIYRVSAVNVAGLESAPTQPVEAEISAKDLSIKPGDLYYSPYRPSVFDDVTFSVKVTNTGLEAAGNTPVAIYAGDPAAGGMLLGEVSTPPLGPGQECLLQYVWDPSGFAGDYTIYVKIDPRNELNEFDETNNVTSRDITITSTAVLEVKVVDVASQDFPRIRHLRCGLFRREQTRRKGLQADPMAS
ncbi:MAG: discoidin domain-containing protein, partial [Firmicutes bacterium]|nr:discoidin domain-containing protein [Bacillota bacterium]